MTRLFLALPLLAACGADDIEPLDLTYGEAKVDAPDEARHADDVSYGEDARQRFDLVHFPDAAAPTPLVIYVHGGGFTGGDEESAWTGRAEFSAALLAEEVAVASCTYRLLEEVDDTGVIKSLTDSARCLQTLRLHAEQLNIDPDRVVVAGTSAGAGTALWLQSHDDLADPASEDPVLRQSTRIRGAVAWETQATYDIVRWDEVFEDVGLEVFTTAEQFGLEQRLLSFYGITAMADLESPEIVAYRADVDMMALQSSDDPPVWIDNSVENATFPITVGAIFHHPFHARSIADAAADAGVEVTATIPKLEIAPETPETALDFSLRLVR